MENADGQEKTEPASGKRMDEARNRGQVSKSVDVTSSAILLLGGLAVFYYGKPTMQSIESLMRMLFYNATRIQLTDESVVIYYQKLIIFAASIILPPLLIIFVISFIAEVAQVGFHFATKKFTEGLNFSSILNPFTGIKKMMFSKQTAVELLKSSLKFVLISLVMYSVLRGKVENIIELLSLPLEKIGPFMAELSYELLYKVGLAYILIAIGDFYYQKWRFREDMKMTKQEVKEEGKQMEGDLQAKARMRQIGRDRLRKIMLSRVKDADVVITNPTHYAIALQYKPGQMDAPKVIAKGVDHLAQQIKKLAAEHNVPIVEDKPLAQTLYKLVEVDDYIPDSLFRAVAQVLAYVFRLRQEKQKAAA